MRRMLECLSGRCGYFLAIVAVAGYLTLSWKPFRWNPPRHTSNGVAVLGSGSVRFSSTGMARLFNPPAWLYPAEQLADLTVHLRVHSFASNQIGPARIFTISQDHYLRNLTIAQEQSHLIVRLRTQNTSLDGEPHYAVNAVFTEPAWRLIKINIKDNKLEILLDGNVVVMDNLPNEPLKNWDPGYRIALGNELTWARPWIGEISQATVSVNGHEIDYLEPGQLEYPLHYWAWRDQGIDNLLETFFWGSADALDVVLNSICFVPLGLILSALRGKRGSVLFSAVFWGIVCLVVELAQIGFDGRYPSFLDWVLNVSGAILGAWLARRFLAGLLVEIISEE